MKNKPLKATLYTKYENMKYENTKYENAKYENVVIYRLQLQN